MKQAFVSGLWLTMFCLGSTLFAELPSEERILKAGGKDAEVIIRKAHSILEDVEVFAAANVGDAGSRTASCWALTVIVRYDPKARTFLEEYYEHAIRPEAKLYAIAGLSSLDPKLKAKYEPADFPPELRDTPVQQINGCIMDTHSTFGMAVGVLIKEGYSPYIFEKLPSIYTTEEVRRFPETEGSRGLKQ